MGFFPKILSSRVFWFGLILIIILGAIYYLVLTREVKSVVDQVVLNQQRTVAKAEKTNILTFLQKLGDSVAVLSQISTIKHGDISAAREDINIFVEQRHDVGVVEEVILTDKSGAVQVSSKALVSTGPVTLVSDQDYFIWGKNKAEKGKYFVSEPIISQTGSTKGQATVFIAAPVYQNNEFKGVVAASVKLEPLVERFFELMKISDLDDVYLVDQEGDLLYNNSDPSSVGSNISEIFSSDLEFRDKIKNALGSTSGGQFQTASHLVSYSPINIETQNWQVIISSPINKSEGYAKPFYIRQIAIFMVTVFMLILFGIIAHRKHQV